MRVLTFDNETTIRNKGNPFTRSNFLCTVGILVVEDGIEIFYRDLNFLTEPHQELLDTIQKELDLADLIIGFNIKFDLHWLRRYGITFDDAKVWDVQVAEFIISNQKNTYPSLDDTGEKYGQGRKLDIVKTEYWDKGIDTPDVPAYILAEYQEQDVRLTYLCYLYQIALLNELPLKHRLITLACQDLLVLEEMEWNGLKYESEKSLLLGDDLQRSTQDLDERLRSLFPGIPINWNSGDHLSAVLFGGRIVERRQIPTGVYKTGIKAGQTKLGWTEVQYDLPRLVEPNKSDELSSTKGFSNEDAILRKGSRMYATNEGVLKSLKSTSKAKEIIGIILERSEKEKLRGTYYHGIPKLCEEMDWEPNMIHGQLNQVVAATGRLSATKPNQQNMPPEFDALLITRF
jgi:DNA polymerase I-like protein with 3'-5' exonuclease and polymerase domains